MRLCPRFLAQIVFVWMMDVDSDWNDFSSAYLVVVEEIKHHFEN
jgi:hypothetical protein